MATQEMTPKVVHESIMNRTETTLERAFELAKSGSVSNMNELRATIKREGYAVTQMDGPALGRQLRALIRKNRP